ncbi:MAG: DUF3658 domain-containing protein [Pyrinomonadaceae bacterium]|nr:DUF3658 domain-containing protein [Pyrinomonadaceae bacterium]
MFEENPIPDPIPTPEEQAEIEKLSEVEIKEVDRVLLSNINHQWRKVTRIVLLTMRNYPNRLVPDIFYASRVYKLVESEHLESQGYLGDMRNSEVRLPIVTRSSS